MTQDILALHHLPRSIMFFEKPPTFSINITNLSGLTYPNWMPSRLPQTYKRKKGIKCEKMLVLVEWVKVDLDCMASFFFNMVFHCPLAAHSKLGYP
ncbi:hypothetical protein GDO78_000398 [Eleutherodactylus coqui]|uniref:Uncharacterized protein n=1 Tax=Eleutherodactylus coqui TaxID=57060 RepID=A0A8J6FPX7_ELECQ|nr:hypothetical protein GDO78_000398 [Eleutherodactylus coqui]